MEVSPIVKLFKSDFGPSSYIFKTLDIDDIINLSISVSSNINEVRQNIKRIRSICHLGRQIETKRFNIHLLSPYFREFMKDLKQFVNHFDLTNITSDSIQSIDNYIYHRKYSLRRILNKDIDIIYQHIKYGEWIHQDILMVVILCSERQYVFFHFHRLFDMMKEYHPNPLLLDQIVPIKALSLVVLSYKDYKLLYQIYNHYGPDLVRKIMDHVFLQPRNEWIESFEDTILSDQITRYISLESDLSDRYYDERDRYEIINMSKKYFISIDSFYKFISSEYNLSQDFIEQTKNILYDLEQYEQ
jgi:hypothetical protein